MIDRLRSTYHDYPRNFWVLVGASFIDTIGSTAFRPFFALYITQRFGVGMTEAGLLFAVFALSSFVGSILGGALADRFGRKSIMVFGLVVSALSSLLLGLASTLASVLLLVIFVGLLSDIAGPAREAAVVDILPERKRTEGFGVLRVAANLAWIVGPSLGGILAAQSFFWIFVVDCITSLIAAIIVVRLIPETRPSTLQMEDHESIVQTFRGYGTVLHDKVYVAFLAVSALMNLVYIQMYTTLSVYLFDVHDVPANGYGYLMSMNAVIVVMYQIWLTRRLRPYRALPLMAAGTVLYAIGFTMYGFVSAYVLFAIAMVAITFGEMIVIPTSSALVARLAPEDMRGRYMAIFGASWVISAMLGPSGGGYLLDNYNPNLVWYLCGILSAVAIAGFLVLDSRTRQRLAAEPVGEAEPAAA
jgi:MFS family permease